MAEAAGEQFSKKVLGLQERIQQSLLPVEKKVAECVLSCFNQNKEHTAVHRCIERCQSSMQTLQQSVQTESQSLQHSVQACQQSLQSRLMPQARDAQGNPDAEARLKKEFEAGIMRCIAEAEPMIPQIESRIMKLLKEHS
eukprot:TRINITY_DN17090_c0_g1_i1.p1 TRINITY_DN17090_c0_g1~~TRINITY_DN17090_c0_g1_i1.p1  ORF type:complete len:159 (-),score=38.02 TRINITY_DN17090_c0_g1_i1:213-632(-)